MGVGGANRGGGGYGVHIDMNLNRFPRCRPSIALHAFHVKTHYPILIGMEFSNAICLYAWFYF